MQLTPIILVLSAATFTSALPRALEARESAEANTTGEKSADFACEHASKIASTQIAEMARLKAQNISVPPYLAGYYTAVNSGIQEIGCPGSVPLDTRQVVPKKDPCDVIDEQHDRMMTLIIRFQADKITIAPFVAGFLSATLDGHKALQCPKFTTPETETEKALAAGGDDSMDPIASGPTSSSATDSVDPSTSGSVDSNSDIPE